MISVAESAILARLSAALAPGSVLVGSFDDVESGGRLDGR